MNKAYDEIQSNITYDLLETKDLHIELDGWTNINNDGIINYVISKPEPLYVKFLNTKDNRYTAKYLMNQILELIETYRKENFFLLYEIMLLMLKNHFAW